MKDIINAGFDNWYTFRITLNWIFVAAAIAAFFIIRYLIKKIKPFQKYHIDKVKVNLFQVGEVELACTQRTREIAFQIWVELKTRKIGLKYEENRDVITEIYNSWYAAFKIIRQILETIPAEEMDRANPLIEASVNILNKGLRPHLTTWQAEFRKWYEQANEMPENKCRRPQDVQRDYERYNILVEDLKKTNDIMVDYCGELEKIAFGKEKR
jgi:hypothetical protein